MGDGELKLTDAIVGFLLVFGITLVLMGALIQGFTSTGPGCPGMDPGYLGYCERD